MEDQELDLIRHQISQANPNDFRRKRYSEEIRRRVAAYAGMRRQRGEGLGKIARDVGVTVTSLSKWLDGAGEDFGR
jgi:transposase-like protein